MAKSNRSNNSSSNTKRRRLNNNNNNSNETTTTVTVPYANSSTTANSISLNYPPYNENDNEEEEDIMDSILQEMAVAVHHHPLTTAVALSSSSDVPTITTGNTVTTETTKGIIQNDKDIKNDDTAHNDDTEEGSLLYNNSIPTRPYSKQQVQRIVQWNINMNTWQRTNIYPNNNNNNNRTVLHQYSLDMQQQQQQYPFLPSFDIEMIRHFKIQQLLSKYLLDTVREYNTVYSNNNSNNNNNITTTDTTSGNNSNSTSKKRKVTTTKKGIPKMIPTIKMPVFERWLIDSKIEEMTTILLHDNNSSNDRKGTTTTTTTTTTYQYNPTSDPILCHMISIQYQSSQRLINEIIECFTTCNNNSNNINTNIDDSNTTTSKKSNNNNTNSKVSQQQQQQQQQYKKDATKIVQELCRRNNTIVQELQSLYQQHAMSNPIKKGDRIVLEGHAPVYTLVYHRNKQWKKPYCIKINTTHYNKLYQLFIATHNHNDVQKYEQQQHHHSSSKFKSTLLQLHYDPLNTNSNTEKETLTKHIFHYLVMIIVIRYSSLSGGQLIYDLRGGGMQGAIHTSVFDVLYNELLLAVAHGNNNSTTSLSTNQIQHNNYFLEGFASPLNNYITGFCSAYYNDIDWHFGSRGNFFTTTIINGICELNPPFAPGIMNAMVERIHYNIEVANNKNTNGVTFIVIVPDGGNCNDNNRAIAKQYGSISLEQMKKSIYCTHTFILPAKDHGYIEGAQHLRPTRYKESLYDTCIIILQSTNARTNLCLNSDKNDNNAILVLEQKVREAFISRHRIEVDSRSEMKQEKEQKRKERFIKSISK